MSEKNTNTKLNTTYLEQMLEKKGRKKFIEDAIKIYRAEFNNEYIKHLKRVKKFRDKQKNKFGSDEDKEFRIGVSIPERLFILIDKVLEDPLFLEDKEELLWFTKKFPMFTVPEKI